MRRRNVARWWDVISKGQFIRLLGRAKWERVPKSYIVKDGKREYVTREGYEDNVWMLP